MAYHFIHRGYFMSQTVTFRDGTMVKLSDTENHSIVYFNEIVRGKSTPGKVHLAFAEALEQSRKVQQAAKEYTVAGKHFTHASQYTKAYQCYTNAIGLNRNSVEAHTLLAYLCKTLGFKEQACLRFSAAATLCMKNQDYLGAICYFDEALHYRPNHVSQLISKAKCIFSAPHPLDPLERTKIAAAVLHPLLKSEHGTAKAKVHYAIGGFYKDTNTLLAKHHLLQSIWCALEVFDIDGKWASFDYTFIENTLHELKKLENSTTVRIIEEFLQCIGPQHNERALPRVCDALLSLRDIPAAHRLKQGDQTPFSEINRYLNLLPKEHPHRKRIFSVHSTGEEGHPNSDNCLQNIIKQAVESDTPWEDFHSQVFIELAEETFFDFRYFFKYGVQDAKFVEIGQSDHLLFFSLFNLDIHTFERMLNSCDESLTAVRDSKGNTILHVAACFGLHQQTQAILKKASQDEELPALINSRNSDGTTPLGMLFLNERIPHERIVQVARLFIREPSLRIDSYLNNQIGMDYRSDPFIQKIGGLTCLHVALRRGLTQLLALLQERDGVNWAFPSQNPKHHMNSPSKLINPQAANSHKLEQFLAEEVEKNDDDSSGDSSDENAPAFQHKLALKDLVKIVNGNKKTTTPPQLDRVNQTLYDEQISLEDKERLEKEVAQLELVHFHGVPFMKGHYTNLQRRLVGKQVQKMNLPRNKEKLEPFRAIHSRTSVATAGVQTLYDVMTASEEQLRKLEATDEQLRAAMSQLWMEKPSELVSALKTFIYDFSQNPIKPFWDRFTSAGLDGIIRYRFPVCSLSKAPDHAVKFAAGKNVETQNLGEERMEPDYSSTGKPRHRLVGLLYVTSHSIPEFHDLQNRCGLADTAQLRSSNQMTSSQARTDQQLEVSFFGGVSGRNVKVVIPIIYPNLSKQFKRGYHDVIWGLSERDMTGRALSLETLIHAYSNFTLRVVKALSSKEGRTPCFIDHTNNIQPFPTQLKNLSDAVTPAQRTIRAGNTTFKGSKKESLEKTTPEALSQPRVYTSLAASTTLQKDVESRAKRSLSSRFDQASN